MSKVRGLNRIPGQQKTAGEVIGHFFVDVLGLAYVLQFSILVRIPVAVQDQVPQLVGEAENLPLLGNGLIVIYLDESSTLH
jgi:hypothetical protein